MPFLVIRTQRASLDPDDVEALADGDLIAGCSVPTACENAREAATVMLNGEHPESEIAADLARRCQRARTGTPVRVRQGWLVVKM